VPLLTARIPRATNILHEYSVFRCETAQRVLSAILEVGIEIATQGKGDSS
jgi:hypothetical protein